MARFTHPVNNFGVFLTVLVLVAVIWARIWLCGAYVNLARIFNQAITYILSRFVLAMEILFTAESILDLHGLHSTI